MLFWHISLFFPQFKVAISGAQRVLFPGLEGLFPGLERLFRGPELPNLENVDQILFFIIFTIVGYVLINFLQKKSFEDNKE